MLNLGGSGQGGSFVVLALCAGGADMRGVRPGGVVPRRLYRFRGSLWLESLPESSGLDKRRLLPLGRIKVNGLPRESLASMSLDG